MRRARCALNQIGYAEKDVGAAGRGVHGVVRIGLFSSLASCFLTELLQAYVADHVVMVEEPRTSEKWFSAQFRSKRQSPKALCTSAWLFT